MTWEFTATFSYRGAVPSPVNTCCVSISTDCRYLQPRSYPRRSIVTTSPIAFAHAKRIDSLSAFLRQFPRHSPKFAWHWAKSLQLSKRASAEGLFNFVVSPHVPVVLLRERLFLRLLLSLASGIFSDLGRVCVCMCVCDMLKVDSPSTVRHLCSSEQVKSINVNEFRWKVVNHREKRLRQHATECIFS